jgi:hypothetical protein
LVREITTIRKAKTVKAFANTCIIVGMKAVAKPNTSMVRPRGVSRLGCAKVVGLGGDMLLILVENKRMGPLHRRPKAAVKVVAEQ